MFMMEIFNELFFIVFLIQLSQCSNHYYKHVDKIDENNNDQFPWLAVIKDKTDKSIYKISYGSLIHFKAVLTSAQAVRGYAAENLVVETKCELADEIDDQDRPYLINCKSRDVKQIIYQNGSNYLNSKKKYAILMLKRRFEMTDNVTVINIALSLDDIDQEDCFIPRWMRLYEHFTGHKRLVTVLYHKAMHNKHFNPKFLDPEQFKTDADHIIGKTFHQLLDNNDVTYENEGYEMKVRTNRINFLGSPFICKDKKNGDYVQIGIVTLRFIINTFKFLPGTFNLHQNGSVFTVYQFHHQIITAVYNNLRVCKNVCYEYCSFDYD